MNVGCIVEKTNNIIGYDFLGAKVIVVCFLLTLGFVTSLVQGRPEASFIRLGLGASACISGLVGDVIPAAVLKSLFLVQSNLSLPFNFVHQYV